MYYYGRSLRRGIPKLSLSQPSPQSPPSLTFFLTFPPSSHYSRSAGPSFLKRILYVDLYGERRMHAGRLRSIGGLSRNLDPCETACSFMNHCMRWLTRIFQAEDLRFGRRNSVHGDRIQPSVCTPGERGVQVVVFEVKPVVAVLQAENMFGLVVVVVGVTADATVDVQFDQPVLD